MLEPKITSGIFKVIVSIFALAAFVITNLTSCDEEPTLSKISFGQYNLRTEMPEDALSDIVYSYGPKIFLDKPATEDIAVYLKSSGTATSNEDYTFTNPVIISKGSTSTSVGLHFINDKLDEFDEIGILKIERVESLTAEIDTVGAEFIILDDDVADLNISLQWGTGGNTGFDQIDMDLYLWRELSPGSNLFELVNKANYHGPLGFEGLQLSGLDRDGLYGISCVYYSGSTDNFSFRLIFQSIGAGILEGGISQREYNPTYNTSNLNSGEISIREQFFTKEGFQFKDITPFLVPESGS